MRQGKLTGVKQSKSNPVFSLQLCVHIIKLQKYLIYWLLNIFDFEFNLLTSQFTTKYNVCPSRILSFCIQKTFLKMLIHCFKIIVFISISSI